QSAGALAAVLGADGLGGVLDERQIMHLGELPQRLHVRALAVQMHRNDRPRSAGKLALDLERIEIAAYRIDIDEHGPGAGTADRADGREEGKGGDDDLVAGADSDGMKGQRQSIGAGSAANTQGDAAVASDFFFEGRHLGAEDDLSRGEDTAQGLAKIRL